jgi:hypothetical protein
MRLADAADEAYSAAGQAVGGVEEIRRRLACAGLEWVAPEATKIKVEKISQDELGAWDEEMRLGQVCAAGVEVRPGFDQDACFDLARQNLYIAPSTVSTDVSASGYPDSQPNSDQSGDEGNSTWKRSATPYCDTISQIVGRFGASNQGFNRMSTQEAPSPTTAHSGDRYDPRWLAFNGDKAALEPSGDGTIDYVGVNLSGTFCCPLCSQQFSAESALTVHTKFFHQVEEVQGEWLSFPSA